MEILRRKRKKKRPGKPRKSRAKPKTGWTLAEFAMIAGTTRRLVRHYIDRDVVPAPEFKGPATRYDRKQLVWLVAARALRHTQRLDLRETRSYLGKMTEADIEALAKANATPGALADALDAGATPSVGSTQTRVVAEAPIPTNPDRRWARLDLAIGLELHVRDDVTPRVRQLAERVLRMCHDGSS